MKIRKITYEKKMARAPIFETCGSFLIAFQIQTKIATQKDKMQTHLSADQIHISAIWHPSKTTKNVVLYIIICDAKIKERFTPSAV